MTPRERVLAALLAVAAVVFAVGASMAWTAGVGLMVGAVLVSTLAWSMVDGDDAVDEEPAARVPLAALSPSPPSLEALLGADDDDELEPVE